MYKLCVFFLIFFLTGCGTRSDLAPVVELKWQPDTVQQTQYKVQKGDTLYAVAFRYDQDYRQLASINHLRRPYALRVGQILTIRSSFLSRRSSAAPIQFLPVKPKQKPAGNQKRIPNKVYNLTNYKPQFVRGQEWVWPVKGRIATHFTPLQGKKGIDIAGKKGEKIRAASSGVIAYAGTGLTGYGNLIIIKHSNGILTAYGNNLRNTVREGQRVKAGQIIAEMGIIDRRFWGVHFEIRKTGKPVNPLLYLKG